MVPCMQFEGFRKSERDRSKTYLSLLSSLVPQRADNRVVCIASRCLILGAKCPFSFRIVFSLILQAWVDIISSLEINTKD